MLYLILVVEGCGFYFFVSQTYTTMFLLPISLLLASTFQTVTLLTDPGVIPKIVI